MHWAAVPCCLPFASTGIVWAPDAQTVVTLSCSQGWKPTTAKCGQANLLDSTQGGHARFLATHARHIHPKVSWDSNGGHPKDGKVQRVDRRGADSRDSTPNTHIPHASTHTHEHARTHARTRTHAHARAHAHRVNLAQFGHRWEGIAWRSPTPSNPPVLVFNIQVPFQPPAPRPLPASTPIIPAQSP